MSIPCVNGQVSKDIQLYHSKLIPIYISQNPVPLPHNFSQERMTYSNEHQDIFRYKLIMKYKKDIDFNIKKFGYNYLINKKQINKVNNLSCVFDAKK